MGYVVVAPVVGRRIIISTSSRQPPARFGGVRLAVTVLRREIRPYGRGSVVLKQCTGVDE